MYRAILDPSVPNSVCQPRYQSQSLKRLLLRCFLVELRIKNLCISYEGQMQFELSTEFLPEYFFDLGTLNPIGQKVGAPEPRGWICQKPGGCFYSLSHEGEAPVRVPGQWGKWPHVEVIHRNSLILPIQLSLHQGLRCSVGQVGIQRMGQVVSQRVD